MKEWSVYIQTAHSLGAAHDRLGAFVDELLDDLEPHAGTVSYDPLVLAARLSVRASDPESALAKARRILAVALRKTKFPDELDMVDVEIETVEELDRRLQQSNIPPLVGIAEVADTLGVSKQRASELSRQPSFPRPLVNLAAGPVWDRHAIARFLERWPRRRTGRPVKHAPNFAERPGR